MLWPGCAVACCGVLQACAAAAPGAGHLRHHRVRHGHQQPARALRAAPHHQARGAGQPAWRLRGASCARRLKRACAGTLLADCPTCLCLSCVCSKSIDNYYQVCRGSRAKRGGRRHCLPSAYQQRQTRSGLLCPMFLWWRRGPHPDLGSRSTCLHTHPRPQESGRAGRDGLPAHCRLYWRFADYLRQVGLQRVWAGGVVLVLARFPFHAHTDACYSWDVPRFSSALHWLPQLSSSCTCSRCTVHASPGRPPWWSWTATGSPTCAACCSTPPPAAAVAPPCAATLGRPPRPATRAATAAGAPQLEMRRQQEG